MSISTAETGAESASVAGPRPVLVTAVGAAEGARPCAAALACAAANGGSAPLLVDLGGRPPRPTLLAAEPAKALEERLVVHLPAARVAARGQLCQLAVPADADGFAVAASALTVARGGLGVVHAPPGTLRELLAAPIGGRVGTVLLRADLAADRAQVALLAADLRERGLGVAVLKRPLGWVASRRALFGLPPGAGAAGLPLRTMRLLGLAEVV